MAFYSCDTFVALGNATESGHVLFAKNSDRPVGEAQPLITVPASDHGRGEMVQCTYLRIPQVPHTYRVVGSKPCWLWGFESGINENNVAIGNEAVWSREPEEKQNGLIGMDLVRLALERSSSAYEALHIITDLLEAYGQGWNCALHMEHRYQNAFLIADPREAWVLETSRRRWAAKKVRDTAAISNCYSIEEEWDEDSGDIREHAWSEGWISPDVPFSFAKAYSAMGMKFRAAYPRFQRSNGLLSMQKGRLTLQDFRRIQRDHFEGELIAPRWSPADAGAVTICMHALDFHSSKTAAALQAELAEGRETVLWHAFGCPCCSVFAPYRIGSGLPEILSNGGAFYEGGSMWWLFERLQYAIEQDYSYWNADWREKIRELENDFDLLRPEDLTDEKIRDNTKKLEALVKAEIRKIESSSRSSHDPQRLPMRDILRSKMKII